MILPLYGLFGGNGRVRTYAGLAPSNGLANRPLNHLGTFPCLAEEVGFEPTNGFPLPVFKTGALSHSAILPRHSVPEMLHTHYACGVYYLDFPHCRQGAVSLLLFPSNGVI